MLLATPTKTLCRPARAPNGSAINTTARQVNGAASRPLQLCQQHGLLFRADPRMEADELQDFANRKLRSLAFGGVGRD